MRVSWPKPANNVARFTSRSDIHPAVGGTDLSQSARGASPSESYPGRRFTPVMGSEMNSYLFPGLRLLILGVLIWPAAGCKSTGLGEGRTSGGDVGVSFQWEQATPTSGKLRAILNKRGGGQETYKGPFFQITRESRLDTLGPLWVGWYPTWVGWPYWGPEPQSTFITHYTGDVVANLEGPDNQRMRCHFRLLRASAGMKGGGTGECQLPSGETIEAEFPPS